MPPSSTGCALPRRAPTSSTSAESPRARGPTPSREDEERRRVVPVIERLARDGGARISIDTTKLAVARAALEAGATLVNDVSAFRFDPGMAGARGRDRRRLLPHAHARRAAHDAGGPSLRRRRLGGEGVPRGAARLRGRPRGSTRSASGSTPGSASARPSSTTSSCCAASTRSSPSAGRWWWARRARASSASSRAAGTRASACPARSPRTCWRSSAGRACSACTTSPRTRMPWRWPLLRSAVDVGEGA